MERSRQSYIYAGLTVLFWSTVPTAFKICLREFGVLPALTIASFTSTIALLVIIISLKKTNLLVFANRKDFFRSALLGFINPFVYYLALLKAYSMLPGQVAQPVNMIWPIILVFLSVPLLGQKIEKKSFIALFISFAGILIISSQGKLLTFGETNFTGILFAAGSSFLWSLYFIFNLRDKRDESVKLFLSFLFGSLYLAIAMTITGQWSGISGLRGTLSSVYIGLFEMGISFFFWLKALQLAKTTDKVSNMVYVAPFLSLLFLNIIVKEPIYFTTPIGLLFIISGIFIQNRKTKIIK
jgi:drug/metabolite transporter (DMT)-like permease